jgi:hypothetical protein
VTVIEQWPSRSETHVHCHPGLQRLAGIGDLRSCGRTARGPDFLVSAGNVRSHTPAAAGDRLPGSTPTLRCSRPAPGGVLDLLQVAALGAARRTVTLSTGITRVPLSVFGARPSRVPGPRGSAARRIGTRRRGRYRRGWPSGYRRWHEGTSCTFLLPRLGELRSLRRELDVLGRTIRDRTALVGAGEGRGA